MDNYKAKTKLGRTLGKAGERIARLFPARKKQHVDTIQSEQQRESEARQTEQEQLAAPPVQPDVETHDTSGTSGHRQDHKKDTDEEFKRTQIRQNWLMFGAAAVTAFATVVYMVVSSLQLSEIRKSANDTQKMIEATQRIANSSQNTSEQNKDLVQIAREQANISQSQANSSAISANAAVSQTKASNRVAGATEGSARAAEQSAQIAKEALRPYVYVACQMQTIEAGKRNEIEIMVYNNGNSPVEEYNAVITFSFRSFPAFYAEKHGIETKKLSDGIIHFNNIPPHNKRTARGFTDRFNDATIEALKRREFYLIVEVAGSYKGSAGESLECAFYNTSTGEFNECYVTPDDAPKE